MIKAGLLGAGIFAKDQYVRVLEENKDKVQLVKVWSRSEATSQDFVSRFAPSAAALNGDAGMEDVLQDPEIALVIVVLPVQGALAAVKRALAAGKHVLEEKPVAGTVDEATSAVAFYRSLSSSLGARAPLWMVAENYRYEDVFHEACRLAPSLLGTVVKLDLVADMTMDANNKYYGTQWRKDTPGMMITESSVHFVAALRMLAAACGLGEATQVSARTFHAKPDLSGPDSVVAAIGFSNSSVPASASITLAASHMQLSLTAVGTEGTLQVSRGGWTGSRVGYTLTWKKNTDKEPQSKAFPFVGVSAEFASFLKLISAHGSGQQVFGSPDEMLGCPEEGARDLALVGAMLESGAKGGTTVKVVSFDTYRRNE